MARRAEDDIRRDLRALHDYIRRSIGTRWSRRHLVDRFKTQCEWYRRSDLVSLAKRSPRRVESILTNELAAFLHTQGMSPLVKAMTSDSGVQPDLMVTDLPGAFYVEAKQYGAKSGKSPGRNGIRRWLAQVNDTLCKFHGTRYQVDKAFLVIFRMDGDRYSLPTSIGYAHGEIFLVIIDLGEDQGSNARKLAISFTETDLLQSQ